MVEDKDYIFVQSFKKKQHSSRKTGTESIEIKTQINKKDKPKLIIGGKHDNNAFKRAQTTQITKISQNGEVRKMDKRKRSFSDDVFVDSPRHDKKFYKGNKSMKSSKTVIKDTSKIFPSALGCSNIKDKHKNQIRKSKTENKESSVNQYSSLNSFFSMNTSDINVLSDDEDYDLLNTQLDNIQIKSVETIDKKITKFQEESTSSVKKPSVQYISDSSDLIDIDKNEDCQPSTIDKAEVENTEEVPRSSTPLVESNRKDTTESKNPKKNTKSNCFINNNYKCFDLDDQKLVILKQKSSVPIFGLCSMKLLYGKVDIFGYTLTKQSKEAKLYSPRGSSLLVLDNVTKAEEEDNFEEIITNYDCLKNLNLKKSVAIFSCSPIDVHKFSFVEKYVSHQLFPKIGTKNEPQIIFNPKDKFNICSINPEWDDIMQSINPSTRLLVTGGKGVGKTNFLRYAINRLLSRFDKIKIIDLDPGQSEFSIPGCLSVITITDPVFGPNYTHIQNSERSFLSNINIGHNPKKYLLTIKHLIKTLVLDESTPVLVNYMGFVKGIGLNIISSAITYIKPTDVLQIDSKYSRKNFKYDLTPETVKANLKAFGGDSKNVNFVLRKIVTLTDDNTGWFLESRQAREICVLAYFGEMMCNEIQSLTNYKLPMYEINFDNIQIRDFEGNRLPEAAVNANLVALCQLESKQLGIFRVLGYGLVRGVDMQTRKLILITPQPLDVLENVFYLVVTSVSMPPSVYMTPDGIRGPMPYVMEGTLEALGEITKRSYIPPVKKNVST